MKTPMPESFLKKETLAQMIPCQFSKNLKSIFFTEHPWVTASD